MGSAVRFMGASLRGRVICRSSRTSPMLAKGPRSLRLHLVATAIISHAMSETIGFLLNDTARMFRRKFNARTRESGITALQSRVLTYLARYPGIRQGPLAELIEGEAIRLSRMIDRLAESGPVERRDHPH